MVDEPKPEVPTELAPVLKEVSSLAEDISMLEIGSREDYAVAFAMMEKLYERNKKVDALLDPIIRQAYQTHRTATEQKRMLTHPITEAIGIIKQKMAVFLMEEKQALEKQAGEAKAKLEAAGFDTSLVASNPCLPVDKTGMVQAETWIFEVVDVSKVPREYLAPDMKKIRAVVTAMKDQTKIDGVKVSKTLSLRRKGGTQDR